MTDTTVASRIVYARGFPYGAPLAMLRGGGTRDPQVKDYLRANGFRWDSTAHAWTHYLDREDLAAILRRLRDYHGCTIEPKANMTPGRRINLDD